MGQVSGAMVTSCIKIVVTGALGPFGVLESLFSDRRHSRLKYKKFALNSPKNFEMKRGLVPRIPTLLDYRVLNELGKGAYGKVYKVEFKIDKKFYAMKEINLKNLTQKEEKNNLAEGSLLKLMSHKNIVKCKEYFKENNKLYIILELAENGDIWEVKNGNLFSSL